jgi:integral membrane protein
MLKSSLGRLRLLGLLEGLSLLLLLGVAVPLKHLYHDPALVRLLGPIHGLLFLLFVLNTLRVGVEQGWRFAATTWKVVLACLIPFGTFYVDRKILRPLQHRQQQPETR